MKKLLFLILPVLMMACKKDKTTEDVSAPEISNFTLDVYEPGDTLKTSVRFTDNESLASAKFEIHSNADGHSHRIADTDTLPKPLNYSKIVNLTGKTQIVDLAIYIPENTSEGSYHFTAKAVDSKGNESGLKTVEFDIESHDHHHHD